MNRLLSKNYIFIIILLFIFELSIVNAKVDSIELAEDKNTNSYIKTFIVGDKTDISEISEKYQSS